MLRLPPAQPHRDNSILISSLTDGSNIEPTESTNNNANESSSVVDDLVLNTFSVQEKNQMIREFYKKHDPSEKNIPQIQGPRYNSFLKPSIPFLKPGNQLESVMPVNYCSAISKNLPTSRVWEKKY